MNRQHNIILTTLFAMALTAGAVTNVAQAGESKEKEAKELQLFSKAKISLIEAIKAAEQNTGGKALEAELDDGSNAVQFEIKILKDGKIYEVLVDGTTGNVIKVSLDDESSESTENEED
jgi:uncharacterized membrane protein YkoI